MQRMVRSDTGASGVMFTLDTESGFRDVVFVTASYGRETVVQGENPDEFYVQADAGAGKPAIIRRNLGSKLIKMVFRYRNRSPASRRTVDARGRPQPLLDDRRRGELELRTGDDHRKHYGRPMDIEGARTASTASSNILQARPETVKSRNRPAWRRTASRSTGRCSPHGRAIGQKIGVGTVRIVGDARDGPRAGGRRARHRHDRPELGSR